jgi:hypothetical protein
MDVMTVETCNILCQRYKYSGLQNGGLCFCGNTYGSQGKAPESHCNRTCPGDPAETCGGNNDGPGNLGRNSIYAVTPLPKYSCDATTGQCKVSANGTLSAEACLGSCKAPTYSCNATVGKCVEDPSGTQTAESCIGSCKCVAPHNCGQLNGTMKCGAVLAGCNVCDSCCQDYFHQHSCDGCFAAPASEQGCGGK